ncbi:oligosaccharide flippase family protein [Methylobacterium sp. BTF04]|uniref:oligosaccharide flippase family protein n=1 Tax=Methylobacterium sp. BTF04 TaxID=2708300 RepID=UPI0013D474C6|nr:oligosaccharide flippase family protein [Methylobacterium sp. BTF04]NEU14472.1 oligosaccharide flippase family protein [Methylobacterium sp. BTF04]
MLGPLIWSLLNAAATVLIPFVLFIVFARTGDAWQVGSVGIAVSIVEILKTICPLGLYEILLRRETTPDEERASLGLLLVSGSVATIAYMAVIVLIGQYMTGFDAIVPILLLLAPKLLFDVASIQPQAALARQLTFRRLAMRTVIANVIAAAVGSGLAFLDHALGGLILYYLLQSALSFLLIVRGQNALVRPSIGITPLKILFRQAGYSSAVRLLAAINNYADTLVVSIFVSTSLVGTYNLSKRLETVLMSTSSSFSAIMYQPLFASRAVAERGRIVENAVRITSLLFGVPVIAFVSFQRDWIGWIFGSRWLDAAPICALLALSGLARIYGSIHGSLLSVSSRNGTLLIYVLCSTVVGLGAVVMYSSSGLIWVAAAIALKSWMFCLVSAYLTRRETEAMATLYFRHVLVPLLWFALIGIGAKQAVAAWSPAGLAGIPPSVLAIMLSAAATLASILVIYRRDLGRIIMAVRMKIARETPAPGVV